MSAAQAERLRQVLLDPAEAFSVDPGGSARAAVLVPLHEHAGELWAVFTQRPRELPRHAGQISFPGGRVEEDDGDLIATALREAHEEIGLPASAVTVLGALRPVFVPRSDFAVHPVVAMIERPAVWTASEREVEAIHELALTELAANHGLATIVVAGGRRETPTFTAGGLMIWGATARILADLLARLELI
jgi:8-oxo-dGTP pyrophosphatase MutT (NUDIX family)